MILKPGDLIDVVVLHDEFWDTFLVIGPGKKGKTQKYPTVSYVAVRRAPRGSLPGPASEIYYDENWTITNIRSSRLRALLWAGAYDI